MAIRKKPRGDGFTYEVCVLDADHHWFPRLTFEELEDAKTYEAECILRARKGEAPSPQSRQTFDSLWLQWSRECRVETSAGWKISQDQMYRDHVKPILGYKRLPEIRSRDIGELMTFCQEKQGLGPMTRVHVFNLVHQIFDDAIEVYEYINVNPAKKRFKPKKPKVVRKFLEPDRAWEFLDHVRNEHLGPAFWIMTLCGLRIGEVQALQWKHVNLAAGHITVDRQWQRKVKAFTPRKNKISNRVSMPGELIDYLAGRKPLGADPEQLVTLGEMTGELVHYDTIEGALKRLCKSGGFPPLAPHELRHTSTEIWVEAGANLEDIRRLLGQESEASAKTYLHRTERRNAVLSKQVGRQGPDLKLVKG